MSFDQMSTIAHKHDTTISNALLWKDLHDPPPFPFQSTCNLLCNTLNSRLTCSGLIKSANWLT